MAGWNHLDLQSIIQSCSKVPHQAFGSLRGTKSVAQLLPNPSSWPFKGGCVKQVSVQIGEA